MALVVLLAAVLVVSRSSDGDGGRETALTLGQEHEGAVNVGAAGTTPLTTVPSALRLEPRTSDISPVLETAGTAMNPPESFPADDGIAAVVAPTTEPPISTPEPESTIPESETTARRPDITALVEGPFVEIDIGWELACGLLNDGRVKCWGGTRAADSAPSEQRFSLVEAGHETACGIDTNGRLACWGLDDYVDLGDTDGPYLSVALAARRLCALRIDGALLCSAIDVDPDIRGIETHSFKAIAAGYAAICALDTNGAASCWGEFRSTNSHALREAEPPHGPFEEIYVSNLGHVACAIRADRTAACWGDTRHIGSDTPPGQFAQLAPGTFHACGLRASGRIECWGANASKQSDAPDGEFVEVSAGGQHSCGLRKNGELLCWGVGWDGGGGFEAPSPSGVFVALETRSWRNCAIRSDGSAVCWGLPF